MRDEIARQALTRDIGRRLHLGSHDEVRVVDRVLQRLELGRDRYGELDLSKPREWRRELREELLDALVYDVAEELATEDVERAGLRDHARAEMLGEAPPRPAADLPGWRQPGAVVTKGAAQRERMSLRGAVLDTIGGGVLSRKRIAHVIHEDWGGCSDELLDSVLDELVEDGELRMRRDRYTRGAA